MISKAKKFIPFVLIIGLPLFYLFSLFLSWKNFGRIDWDQHLFYHAVPLKTIKEFFQFPLWNPYYCGGHVLLQNPQSRFLGPFFFLHLLFGELAGLKLEMIIHYIMAFAFYFLISKNIYKIKSPYLFIFPAAFFIFNSFFSSHFSVGHTTFFASAYMPGIYYFFIRYTEISKLRYPMLAGLLMAFCIFEGGVYVVSFMAPFLFLYSLLFYGQKKSTIALKSLFLTGAWSLLFSAIKTIPMISYMSSFKRGGWHSEKNPLEHIFSVLTSGHQNASISGFNWGDYESEARMGVVFFGLFCISIFYLFKNAKAWKSHFIHVSLGVFFLFYAFGEHGALSPYMLLRKMPIFSQLNVSFRVMGLVIFAFSMIFFPLLKFVSEKRSLRLVALLIAPFALADIGIYSSKQIAQYLDISPSKIKNTVSSIQEPKYRPILNGPRYFKGHGQYSSFLANRGEIACYESLPIHQAATHKLLNDGKLILPPGSVLRVLEFSPNKVSAQVDHSGGPIILNQNYSKGWKVQSEGETLKAFSHKGRTAIALPAKKDLELSFYYRPDSFILGAILSFMGICFSLYLMTIGRKKWDF